MIQLLTPPLATASVEITAPPLSFPATGLLSELWIHEILSFLWALYVFFPLPKMLLGQLFSRRASSHPWAPTSNTPASERLSHMTLSQSLTLSISDIWGQVILCCWGLSWASQTVQQRPWSPPTRDALSTSSHVVTQNVSRRHQMSLGEGMEPVTHS